LLKLKQVIINGSPQPTGTECVPYFRQDRWGESSHKYIPDIWIANPTVFHRKDMFLQNNLFHRVTQTFGETGETNKLSGIEFTLIKRREIPFNPSYAEYTHVFRLKYLQ